MIMKESPLLCSAEMVRAILEGRQTQTRRPVKPQPAKCRHKDDAWIWRPHHTQLEPLLRLIERKCPFGQPGDRLWVRETWRLSTSDDCDCYEPCSCKIGTPIYRASWSDDKDGGDPPWRPSNHMPRKFSRITLEVVNVRVERLQDISESDAKAEGVEREFEIDAFTFIGGKSWNVDKASTHCLGFKHTWRSCYPKGDFAWDKNPFVWVVGFKRL